LDASPGALKIQPRRGFDNGFSRRYWSLVSEGQKAFASVAQAEFVEAIGTEVSEQGAARI